MDVQVGPPVVTIYDDDQIPVCAHEATICAEKQQGYFCADTRLVSSYRVQLSRTAGVRVGQSKVDLRLRGTDAVVTGRDGALEVTTR